MAVNVEAFYDMINGIAKQQVQATPMDLTIDATIAKLYNVDIGEYKVEYQGNIFSAFTTDPTVTYNVGERVYVLVPQGDFSTKKVILGYSKYESNLSDSERIDLQNQYIVQGPNWYEAGGLNYQPDHEPLQICAVPVNKKQNLTTEAFYEDIGFQREAIHERFVETFNELLKQHETATVEKMKTILSDLEANSREIADYFSNIDFARYEKDEAYRNEIAAHLNQVDLKPDSHPVGVPASIESVAGVDERFQYYSEAYDYMMISAKFRTEFQMPHYSGKYYLSVMFWCNNPKYREVNEPDADLNRGEPNIILKELQLGFNQFNGSPYTFVVDTPQKAFYKINPGEFRGLYKVSLMQDGTLVADIIPSYNDETGGLEYKENLNSVYDKNNIFCSDIDIRFAKRVDMLDTPYYCFIETPKGDSFYSQDDSHPRGCTQVDLVPHYIHVGQEITQDCEIHWYREDLSVMPSTPDDKDAYGKIWTDYTGPGWRPVEQLADEAMGYWKVHKDGTLTVYDVPGSVPWKWRFKCVCIYTQTDGEKMVYGVAVQEVVNKNSKYKLYLEEIVSQSNSQTSLRINEREPHRVGLDLIPGTTVPYQEWFGSWYVELSDGSYIEVDETSLFRKGPLIINKWLIYDMVTFRVACYDPRMIKPEYGQGDITNGELGYQSPVIGYLEKTYINSVNGNMIIDWIGRKSFNYTAIGDAYPDISSNEYTLQPKLKWNLDPMNYHMIILAPDGATLGSRNFYNQYLGEGQTFANQAGKGYDVNGKSMMTDMYIDHENVVHFKVRPEIEPTKCLNTLVARVLTIADGSWYECPCEVLFTKDGQSGTQGSGWTAPLRQVDEFEGGRVVYDPVTEHNVVVASPAYTTPIGFASVPLCIEKSASGKYIQSPNSRRIIIRPFVTKEGRDLMQDKGDGSQYKVVVSWDVRFPQNATLPQIRNSSFLRLYNPEGEEISFKENTGELLDPRQNGLVHTTVNPKGALGLIGQTMWDGSKQNRQLNKNYCAVEVKFEDNAFLYAQDQLEPKRGNTDNAHTIEETMLAMNYNFVIKATINIYSNDPGDFPATSSKDKYDDILNKRFGGGAARVEDGIVYSADGNIVESDNLAYTPTMRRVKTITSYYPVDIFIKDSSISENFDPAEIGELNWPREIQFDAQGGNPVVGAEYLTFLYGGNDKEHLIKPRSLVQSIATVQEAPDYSQVPTNEITYDDGDQVTIPGDSSFEFYQRTLEKESISRWKYRPVTTINWDLGFVATLQGRINFGGVSGQFIRNQVFMLNKFSNVAINNWDGHSITLDDENGVILAPQFAAGFKSDFSNLFYGVVMGKNTSFPRLKVDGDKNPITNGGIDQLAAVGAMLDEQIQENYMTGIFGYQSGIPSFGLLENGTAFFGRLDRGGGIIIDGYNATIYGGANGVFTSPQIGDDMWNSMRLTLVDLSHATNRPTDDLYDEEGRPYGIDEKPFSDDFDSYEDYFYGSQDGEREYDENGNIKWKNEIPTYDVDTRLADGEFFGVPHDGAVGEIDENTVVTTDIRGRTQGFGGGFFGRDNGNEDPYGVINKLPSWYKMVWMGAYILPKGETPYWLDDSYKKNSISAQRATTQKEVWVYATIDEKGNTVFNPAWEQNYKDLDNASKYFFIPNPRIVPQIDYIVNHHKDGIEALDPTKNGSGRKLNTIKIQEGMPKGEPLSYELGYNNLGVNYWAPSVKQIRAYMGVKDEKGGPVSGFGPSRASTTPAIEIGQHPSGLMPGLIPLDYPIENIFKEMFIPGDRNFMVTYDGTLWAMNGVFLGNVIGSNVIGGRINGSEIGIGGIIGDDVWENWLWLEDYGNWGIFQGPHITLAKKGDDMWRFVEPFTQKFIRDAQIKANGEALFNKIFVTGGELHMGTFHILGKKPWYYIEGSEDIDRGPLDTQHGVDNEGHLIQFGVSDFLGPTHFYGTVGIGPNLDIRDNDNKRPWSGGKGHLLQTYGLAALGIILPPNEDNSDFIYTFHQKMSEAVNYDNKSTIYFMDRSPKFGDSKGNLIYTANSYNYGKPNIQSEANGISIEQMAMFSIYTAEAPHIGGGGASAASDISLFAASGSGGSSLTSSGVNKDAIEKIAGRIRVLYDEAQNLPLDTRYSTYGPKIAAELQKASAIVTINLPVKFVASFIHIQATTIAWTPGQVGYYDNNNVWTTSMPNAIIDFGYEAIDNIFGKIQAKVKDKPNTAVVTKKPTSVAGNSGYIGHFWPLAFRYMQTPDDGVEGQPYDDKSGEYLVHAYTTTMDIFATKGTLIGNNNSIQSAGGSNYFRIGPWGQEGMRYYFMSGWQRENVSRKPTPDRVNDELKNGRFENGEKHLQPGTAENYNTPRGFIGVGEGHGGQTAGPPIILQTWGRSKLFLQSDNEINNMAIIGESHWAVTMSKAVEKYLNGYKSSYQDFVTGHKHRVNMILSRVSSGFGGFSNDPNHCTVAQGGYTVEQNGESPAVMDVVNDVEQPDEVDYRKHIVAIAAGIGKGFGNTTSGMTLGFKVDKAEPEGYQVTWGGGVEATASGLTLDPQDRMDYSLPDSNNGGHGGLYLYGKQDSGVHIMQLQDKGEPKPDGTVSELFLFHEQASLVGQKVVMLGTYPTNYENIKSGANPGVKNLFGGGSGMSHVPDTTKGSAIAFIEGMLRSINKSGFTFVAGDGMNYSESENCGWKGSCNPAMGIGGGANEHMEIFHKTYVNIHKGTVGDNTADGGKRTPSIGVGMDDKGNYGDACYISDSKGSMKGLNGHVWFQDEWANETHQHNIYARFA